MESYRDVTFLATSLVQFFYISCSQKVNHLFTFCERPAALNPTSKTKTAIASRQLPPWSPSAAKLER